MKLYTCAFAFTPDARHILLLRKHEPIWQRGKLNGIGGKVEPGETILEATRREFCEETKLSPDEMQFDATDPKIFHAMLWPEYATHIGWPLVYFSAFTMTLYYMRQAVLNTCNDLEPCGILRVEELFRFNDGILMPNIPFLVEMAKTLVLCSPEERKLRQPVVLSPEHYALLLDIPPNSLNSLRAPE